MPALPEGYGVCNPHEENPMNTRNIQPASKQDHVTSAILALDLGPIKFKMMSAEGGGYSRDTVLEIEIWYRRFLMLTYLNRGMPIVPSKQVDAMWHAHILDTAKYMDDCNKIFGQYLHHFPYFGVRGEEDRTNLESSWERTKELLRFEFAEDPNFDVGMALCAGGSECGNGCAKCGGLNEIANIMMTDIRPTFGDIAH